MRDKATPSGARTVPTMAVLVTPGAEPPPPQPDSIAEANAKQASRQNTKFFFMPNLSFEM